jgi:hypothetical protein
VGIWPVGIWPVGIWPLGICPVGIWPAGIWPVGIWPVGIWPVGIWPVGIWPVGILTHNDLDQFAKFISIEHSLIVISNSAHLLLTLSLHSPHELQDLRFFNPTLTAWNF